MALTVRADVWQGSGLITLKGGGTRTIRVFFVDGITGPPEAFYATAVDAPTIPKPNEQHPALPKLLCVDKRVEPAGPSQAYVFVVYEDRQTGGVAVERLSIRDTVTLGQETVQRSPLSGIPLKIYRSTTSTGTPKIQQVSYPVPIRNRVMYGLFSSARPDAWKLAVNCVNGKPFMGYDVGYWLCTFYDEQWSDLDRKFRVTIGISTKQTHDWSVWATMREVTGEFVNVTDSVFQQVVAAPYRQGMIWQTDGVGRWGMHKLCDFGALFDSFLGGL